jgi:AraC family transcriptional regulator of arabinose operon
MPRAMSRPSPRRRDGFPGQRLRILPRKVLHEALLNHLDPVVGVMPSDLGFFPRAAGHEVSRPGGCGELVVIVCLHGQGWGLVGGHRLVVTAGQALVLPPNQAHAYGADEADPWSIAWLHVAGSRAAVWASILAEPAVRTLADPWRCAALIEEACDHAERAVGFGSAGFGNAGFGGAGLSSAGFSTASSSIAGSSPAADPASARACAGAAAHALSLLALPVVSTADPVQQVMAAVRSDLGFPWTLAALAARSGLSAPRFAARFRGALGQSPLRWLTAVRIEAAAHLLATTTLPVQVVAQRVGFADALHFSRRFRAVQGMSPRQWRQRQEATPGDRRGGSF